MQKYTVIINHDKTVYWYKFGTGILHRENGPAIEYANGDCEWFIDGKRHRIGEPAIVWTSGKHWFVDNKRHRIGAPAIERANGDREWFVEDKRHRIEGPAIEYISGSKLWYLNGRCVTEEALQEVKS
jgi:hypothetical protein